MGQRKEKKHVTKMFQAAFLLILLLSVLLPSTHIVRGAGITSQASSRTVTKDYDSARTVLSLVNQERRSRGLTELKLDYNLTNTAMIRAAESAMSFSHTRPDGTSCFTAFPSTTGRGAIGENLAAGRSSASLTMNDWMNSQGHKDNILNADYRYIGIGCVIDASGRYRYYWAQEFADSMNPYVSDSRTGRVTETAGTGTETLRSDPKPSGQTSSNQSSTNQNNSQFEKYRAVFDPDYYLNRYADLRAAYGNDRNKALHHFLTFGMKEGRRGNEAFDVNSYRNQYADLRVAFGKHLEKYYQHYLTCGKREGRAGNGCSTLRNPVTVYQGTDYSAVYDFQEYQSRYPDIRRAFGNDDVATLRHFVTCGMREGRIGKSAFDVHSYKNEYGDLRAAFGKNLPLYYLHYIRSGQKERRHGNGCGTLQNPVTVYQGVDYSSVYDYAFYQAANPDVKQAYGSDDVATLQHFVFYGMKEGRQAKENFRVQIYQAKYPDLQQAFGGDLKKYYIHYMNHGIFEGRSGQ